MADDSVPPYWVLISVLFSSVALSPSLAMDLFWVALQLHRHGEERGEIRAELARGTVENLKREMALGQIAGPLFEASLDTERGHATVRFLLTRQGLDLAPRETPRELLN